MKELLELVYTPRTQWESKARPAFNVALRERYLRVQDLEERKNDERRFQLRVNSHVAEGNVPYAALIPPDQDLNGPYGGMSFVVFPSEDEKSPALLAMGVGTNGLAPDEAILGRPGHARKCAAIAAWLNAQSGSPAAWAKRDPVRTDLNVPDTVRSTLSTWTNSLRTYGNVLYLTFAPPRDRSAKIDKLVADAIAAMCDLFFVERRIEPKQPLQADVDRLRRDWMTHLMPDTTREDVVSILDARRFVVLEGPPGTGKTTMARSILEGEYGGRGRIVQFHAGTTYESFVGGLSPQSGGAMGFTFAPTAGHLITAAEEATANPGQKHLLVIDEINRADLAKVLGEALYLLEPNQPDRTVRLQYAFPGVGQELRLPENLDVIGTMNSADRSIAILDVAVRRRFAFVRLWPQLSVVEQHSGSKLQEAFRSLLSIFIEHANNEAVALMPGHSYFLGTDDQAAMLLRTGVRPLLEEYLAQGYVGGFADDVRAYLDGILQEH